ncbi:MAG: redoxin domain-containing protein [Solobacterium sp.]|nr:redoxin domain-containing protein [Solobacterium sp.]
MSLSLVGLFLEGLLSFFSPCVLPLVPLYIGYLTQGLDMNEDKNKLRKKTVFLTFFFVLGICTVFFIAGLGSSALRSVFEKNKLWFQLIGGIVLVLFGLFSLGWIRIPFLEKERRLPFKMKGNMNYLNAYLLGFFFSFAWSPCIGPLLASAMMVASSASTPGLSILYMLAYTLGFIFVFILIGLFTEEVMGFIKKHASIVRHTKLVGGAVVLGMGIYMLNQGVTTIRSLQSLTSQPIAENGQAEVVAEDNLTDIEKYDVTLTDYDGNKVQLSSYKGKTTMVMFFGTWCHYCNQELPHLQEIQNEDTSVKIVLIAQPNVGTEGDKEYIHNFLSEKGYSMEVLYDENGQATMTYGIAGYPTTFIFKEDGNVFGYVPGYASKESLVDAIAQSRG